jgi:hypothetical protein
VLVRRHVFRQQLDSTRAPGIPPFLFCPAVPYQAGLCFSCGVGLQERCFGRCWRCSLAWRLACGVPVPPLLASALDDARVV